ncbi:unnamed protein product [Rhizopus stolonifer]
MSKLSLTTLLGTSSKKNDIDNESLRPDIIFYPQQQEEVVEVGCGEVKKPDVSQDLLDKDKTRVLEMMKCQLHLHLCRAKKEYEAVTFGVLVQGTTVIYMYHEEQPLTLSTTYHSYTYGYCFRGHQQVQDK